MCRSPSNEPKDPQEQERSQDGVQRAAPVGAEREAFGAVPEQIFRVLDDIGKGVPGKKGTGIFKAFELEFRKEQGKEQSQRNKKIKAENSPTFSLEADGKYPKGHGDPESRPIGPNVEPEPAPETKPKDAPSRAFIPGHP